MLPKILNSSQFSSQLDVNFCGDYIYIHQKEFFGVLQQVKQMSNRCERLVTEWDAEEGGRGSFTSLNLCYG